MCISSWQTWQDRGGDGGCCASSAPNRSFDRATTAPRIGQTCLGHAAGGRRAMERRQDRDEPRRNDGPRHRHARLRRFGSWRRTRKDTVGVVDGWMQRLGVQHGRLGWCHATYKIRPVHDRLEIYWRNSTPNSRRVGSGVCKVQAIA